MSRLRIKYFIDDPAGIDPPELVPVFHRWIQRDALSGLWIDVADYVHVPEGPSIMLIGHEADLSLDFGRGRPGLAITRKRGFEPTLEGNIRLVVESLLAASARFDEEAALEGRYRLRTDEIEITFLDRLSVPPESSDISTAVAAIGAALSSIFGVKPESVERIDDDARHPVSLRVRVPQAPSASAILEFQTTAT